MKVALVPGIEIEKFHALQPENLFTSKQWCDCFDQRLKRFFILDDNEKAIGGFVAFEGGKMGIKTLITPPFTPHIGLFLVKSGSNTYKENSLRKAVTNAIADFLKQSPYAFFKLEFPPGWEDMQPVIWKNISTRVRYTYRTSLDKTENGILEQADSKTRNMISKAVREGATASHVPDAALGLNMVLSNLSSKSIAPHKEILSRILHLTAEERHGLWTLIKHHETVIAINVCVHDKTTCYNLLSAINREARQNFGGTFALHNSTLKSKEKGLSHFDFEGSDVPEIETFFRSFGGDITPYYSITGGKWPWYQLMKWRKK